MRKRGLAKRIVSTTLAAVLCVGMMGNVPMVSMAQESVEVETETATGLDADFGAGFETDGDVEAPAFVDKSEEPEETMQEETDEEIIEDEGLSLTAVAGDWRYSDNDDGTVTITKYTGKDTEVVIPKQIDGKTVTGIGNHAFYECSNLTSIEISTGVTSIGDGAFYGCSSLASIKIPEGVTSIGIAAFVGCSNLTGIEIPKGVTSIGAGAFQSCSNLTSIKISTSVTSIGDFAFTNCNSLTSVEIPEGVTSIGAGTFIECSSLVSIDVDKNNANYKSKDGILYDGDMTTLICYPGGRGGTVYIPEGVTEIGTYAFWGHSNLINIEIPSSLSSIGSGFSSHSSLVSINVNKDNVNYKSKDGILYDGDMATLICCPGGKDGTVHIPESVTSIGDHAFYGCSSLPEIKLPESVTSIGDGAFYGCSSLTEIKLPEGVTDIKYIAFSHCSNLTSIEIPSSVTSIEEMAFKECSNLTSIEIPASVMSIEYNAFDDCNNLTIYGTAGSAAERYANEYNIPFKLIEESTETDLSKLTVIADSVTYNGNYQTAKLYIQDGENKLPLVEGVDYTGTVRRKEAGTTTVKITGKGDYTGETTVSFTVNPLHLKNALEAGDVVFTAGDLEYTGRLLYSPVKVTYKGKVLKEGTDYTLKGNGRKAVGTSWAVVTGTGNYTGTIKVKYAMKKASQSKMIVYTKDARAVDVKKKGATVQLVASSVRDGAKITYSVEKPNQGITVSSNGKVTVKKGTKPGKYRIKVLAQSTQYYKATSKYFTVVVK